MHAFSELLLGLESYYVEYGCSRVLPRLPGWRVPLCAQGFSHTVIRSFSLLPVLIMILLLARYILILISELILL